MNHHKPASFSLEVLSQAKATDPVCGMSVDPANAPVTAAHEGQTYYFTR
jgi:Cu+-exporting ATPase